MNITIETAALKTLLYGIISCQCPVTPKTEAALFDEFRKQRHKSRISLCPFLDIADTNPSKTPLHLFLEFCSFSYDDPTSLSISHNDVLRYFSSSYHFDRIVASINPLQVYHTPSHIISHMILPVFREVETYVGETVFFYRKNSISITFKNVFVPPEFDAIEEELYGVHFGMVLLPLTKNRAEIIERQIGLIYEFPDLLLEVGEVDFSNYQSFGNYQKRTEKRFTRINP
jgi:hypothetical protein